MRRPLTFDCQGATLAGVLHPADGDTGVIIVSGGVQTRAGSHRGFVALADRLAAAGYPTFRFDRRGVGDSDGDDPGYRDSGADLSAAVVAIRRAAPKLHRVVAWGLCDGASALALHGASLGLDAMILVNPWTRDADDDAAIPPRAVVAARYRERLRSRDAWGRLLRGGLDLRKAAQGLRRLARAEPTPVLAHSLAAGLQRFDKPMLVVLAGRDATAQAFASMWRDPVFAVQSRRPDIAVVTLPSATHTFARREDAEAMADHCIAWLGATADRAL